MNTIENSPVDLAPDLDDPLKDGAPFTKPEISGFDSGTRSLFLEPSLYLSIAVVFIVALVSSGSSPLLFWTSFIGMSALALIFHVLAERIIFKGKTEFAEFAAPFEGVFVVTFGALLPGLGLLAYGIYSLSSSLHQSIFEDMGKMALLLIVPIFNYAVWSAVRRGYLIRPRLVGLMSGLSLGLSVSWAAIFVKYLLAPADGSCKFGWMLLLCISPFLLFAALCLSIDLWHRTEAGIRRIATAFSVMGVLLSFLFVFAPMVRTFSIQSVINDARQNSSDAQAKAITVLRSIATPQDLRPSKYPVGGFNLAELLISGRGLDSGTGLDRDIYFRITGKPYSDAKSLGDTQTQLEQSAINPLVGPKLAGLSLARSQFIGNVDALTLSSSVDWTLTFCNTSEASQEASGEIHLPNGAVVSRATLWIDGEPREATFLPMSKAQAAYDTSNNGKINPLLVTMTAPDRVLVRCFPVPPSRAVVKVRLGFKVPLETEDGKTCSMELPHFVDTNFSQPRRHRINITSRDALAKTIPGIEERKAAEGYLLDGVIKMDHTNAVASLAVRRSARLTEFATSDSSSHETRFIVQRLQEVALTPKHLFVVIDPSASLKESAQEIRKVLSNLPAAIKPAVFLGTTLDTNKTQQEITAKSVQQALADINSETFVGGQDNGPALKQALETAAEQPNSAVLWIHGPQPLTQTLSDTTLLDLVHNVHLYDLQTDTSSVPMLEALKVQDPSNLIQYVPVHHDSLVKDVNNLVSQWNDGTAKFTIKRTLVATKPDMTILHEPTVSAQLTSLWAAEEIERLIENGHVKQAQQIASAYSLVTPITGAVVLDNVKDDKSLQRRTDEHKVEHTAIAPPTAGGLVGAPVDPRFGQSNEVGMMADFGYDTARNICRILTAVSFLLSLIVGIVFLRSRPKMTSSVVAKGAALVVAVPLVVHLMGTYMINNFGGLGGGL